MTDDEFAQYWGNIFAQFSLTDKQHPIGSQVYELWQAHGEELLQRAGYTGITRHPECCNVNYYGEIHHNLRVMLAAFGEPGKVDE